MIVVLTITLSAGEWTRMPNAQLKRSSNGVSSNKHHTLVLKDGKVLAFGLNAEGILGTDVSPAYDVSAMSPVTVKYYNANNQYVDLDQVIDVATTPYNSFALRADGTVWAWGSHYSGLRGDNTYFGGFNVDQTIPAHVPVQVKYKASASSSLTTLTNVVELAAGDGFMLALLADGSVLGWGDHQYGQLGQTSLFQTYTVWLDLNSSVTYKFSSYAIKCFDVQKFITITAGAEHALGLGVDGGKVFSWGRNNQGQLGRNASLTFDTQAYPVIDNGGSNLTKVVTISAGAYHNVVQLVTGKVKAWGQGTSGELGQGTTTNSITPQFMKMSVSPYNDIQDAVGVCAGDRCSFVLTAEGKVYSAGLGTNGTLGHGTTSNETRLKQLTGISTGTVWALPESCQRSVLMRKTDGNVVFWGLNDEKQMINTTTVSYTNPTTNAGSAHLSTSANVKQIALGKGHGTIIRHNGSVVAWGANVKQQVNLNANGCGYMPHNISTPESISQRTNGNNIIAASCGPYSSYYLRSDGTVYSVGDWEYGNMGDGRLAVGNPSSCDYNLSKMLAPTVEGSNPFYIVGIDGGLLAYSAAVTNEVKHGTFTTTAAVTSRGKVVCFGANHYAYSQCGQGVQSADNHQSRSVYVKRLVNGQPVDLENIVQVAASGTMLFALDVDGKVYRWGKIATLTTSTKYDYATEVGMFPTGNITKAISANGDRLLALSHSGTVAALGHNPNGECGRPNTTTSFLTGGASVLESGNPIQNIKLLSAGTTFAMLLSADGKTKCFGNNSVGQCLQNNFNSAQTAVVAKVDIGGSIVDMPNASLVVAGSQSGFVLNANLGMFSGGSNKLPFMAYTPYICYIIDNISSPAINERKTLLQVYY